jgi:cyclopropane fatty-acyl-phospholipid synthase-like methyltransferase
MTSSSTPASIHSETGRGHGLSIIFWLLEQPGWKILTMPTVVALVGLLGAVAAGAGTVGMIAAFVATWLAVPLFLIVLPVIGLIMASRSHDDGSTDWEPYIAFKDAGDTAKWKGKKIPMEVVYHAYMADKLVFKQDVYDTFLARNGLFRFCFTANDIWFYVRTFIAQNLGHTIQADEGDIAHVYNRGNDFYNWFLGETMIYTSGIFHDRNESLEVGQRRKLDTVCQYVQMKPGDRHLDIGCGWGTLISWSAKHYGAESTGITLAKEQAEWGRATAEREGVSDKVRIIVDDYRKLPSEKWDKITCLEMAEHVGIKNFQKFLLQVRHMLKDDGIFYLQIAGLRRPWQFEDLVWGLFMGKYIFPGADASAPLGFVVNQAERAGWEVHRVENCGVHYSLTIKKWYDNWKSNEAAIVAKYGHRWFSMWMVFLAWSAIIAAQGSSTVFMITLTKNETNDKDSVDAATGAKVSMNRMQKWVGPKPVATQQ